MNESEEAKLKQETKFRNDPYMHMFYETPLTLNSELTSFLSFIAVPGRLTLTAIMKAASLLVLTLCLSYMVVSEGKVSFSVYHNLFLTAILFSVSHMELFRFHPNICSVLSKAYSTRQQSHPRDGLACPVSRLIFSFQNK